MHQIGRLARQGHVGRAVSHGAGRAGCGGGPLGQVGLAGAQRRAVPARVRAARRQDALRRPPRRPHARAGGGAPPPPPLPPPPPPPGPKAALTQRSGGARACVAAVLLCAFLSRAPSASVQSRSVARVRRRRSMGAPRRACRPARARGQRQPAAAGAVPAAARRRARAGRVHLRGPNAAACARRSRPCSQS